MQMAPAVKEYEQELKLSRKFVDIHQLKKLETIYTHPLNSLVRAHVAVPKNYGYQMAWSA